MRKSVFIFNFFLSVFAIGCLNRTNKANDEIKIPDDISVLSYKFIKDTNQIQSLIQNKIGPSGLPFEANKLLNQYVKITLKNNTNDTIFFSSTSANIPSPMDSLILSYCPVTLYSQDSTIWERPSGVRDYFPTFNEPVFTKQTVTRFLYIEPFENAKYFEISIHYQIHDSLKAKLIILKQ